MSLLQSAKYFINQIHRVLSENDLTTLPSLMLAQSSLLSHLLLGQNKNLTALPSDAFIGLSALDSLVLDGSGLTSLPRNLLLPCPNLDTLYDHRGIFAFFTLAGFSTTR